MGTGSMTMFLGVSSVVLLLLLFPQPRTVDSFTTCNRPIPPRTTRIFAGDDDPSATLSSLPKGISPFEKSLSKNIDVQSDFRTRAKIAVDAYLASATPTTPSTPLLLEIEFPPLLGGSGSKSQFDDFDNVQELDSNKDWAVQFAPLFLAEAGGDTERSPFGRGRTWLTFPDLKECELAREEWPGKRYGSATFTTLKAACEFLVEGGNNDKKKGGGYNAPWGAALAEGFNKILGSTRSDDVNTAKNDAGLLGDVACLTPLVAGENSPPKLNIVVQPGNGGPVEDWINVETIYTALSKGEGEVGGRGWSSSMVVVNGALDKVRDGYYPAVFFPDLAKTAKRFYSGFETVFYLKPITDKGLYGWLFRVYPEPWQVVLQTVETGKNGESYVVDKVVYTSDERPTYALAVSKMIGGAAE